MAETDPNQPRTQYQLYQQQPVAAVQVPPNNRTWNIAKLVLTSLSIAFNAIILGISTALAVNPAVQSYIVMCMGPQAGFTVGLGLTANVLAFALAFVGPEDRGAYPEAWNYYYDDYGNNDSYDYYSESHVSSMESLVAFLAVLAIVHFVLFVRACVETAQRERMKNDALVKATP
ncbi:hypothetical protein AAE478_002661 [Parahypoxylon ruwenzoriense]